MKNRIPRIYIDKNVKTHEKIILNLANTHYITNVLRMNIEEKLEVFNNTNYVFLSKIIEIKKKIATIIVLNKEKKNIESPLSIHLGLAVSKNEKMNFAIQKCIELGVNTITPIFSKHCNIHRNKKNILKKMLYWKNIIVSACQQCKRNIIPKINNVEDINFWMIQSNKNETKIVLNPKSSITLNQLPKQNSCIRLLVGCEGGLSSLEMQTVIKHEFIPIKLGPRILRTETAAIAAVTALQMKFGDLLI
ncbi:16S rRNA methyltransferase [Buchnera aphidicola (Aphis glycines)]|uniref:Ribosomal RNA small subunit methyltransferase E n=1 Tax=Buchnera aphidicola (Aphis glycines) TaxID=1265350 RepID=A0A0M3RSK1_9GAMM|nr:16S rRNA (uracil(1498)-N(3))-methyltransferase [Buchnera aphidicola]ALD15346.1 16S rRNA methyltransferase [Buchnera aphidicola (Aphis glycines)]